MTARFVQTSFKQLIVLLPEIIYISDKSGRGNHRFIDGTLSRLSQFDGMSVEVWTERQSQNAKTHCDITPVRKEIIVSRKSPFRAFSLLFWGIKTGIKRRNSVVIVRNDPMALLVFTILRWNRLIFHSSHGHELLHGVKGIIARGIFWFCKPKHLLTVSDFGALRLSRYFPTLVRDKQKYTVLPLPARSKPYDELRQSLKPHHYDIVYIGSIDSAHARDFLVNLIMAALPEGYRCGVFGFYKNQDEEDFRKVFGSFVEKDNLTTGFRLTEDELLAVYSISRASLIIAEESTPNLEMSPTKLADVHNSGCHVFYNNYSVSLNETLKSSNATRIGLNQDGINSILSGLDKGTLATDFECENECDQATRLYELLKSEFL